MEIENGRILVMAAVPNRDEDDLPPGYVEFYRIDGVLALQDYQGHDLTGHPGKDLALLPGTLHEDALLNTYAFFHHDEIKPDSRVWGCAFQMHRSDVKKIRRITERGDMVAIWFNRHRNKRGESIRASVKIAWRKVEKYLSQEQILWLQAYSASSFMLVDQLDTAKAIRNVFHWIGKMAKAQPEVKPPKQPKLNKKKKIKRKTRRKQEQEWSYANL